MMELMARLLSTQAEAQATSVVPRFSACSFSFSAIIRLSGRHFDFSMRRSWRPARLPGSAFWLTLYSPVSTPRASGL